MVKDYWYIGTNPDLIGWYTLDILIMSRVKKGAEDMYIMNRTVDNFIFCTNIEGFNTDFISLREYNINIIEEI